MIRSFYYAIELSIHTNSFLHDSVGQEVLKQHALKTRTPLTEVCSYKFIKIYWSLDLDLDVYAAGPVGIMQRGERAQ